MCRSRILTVACGWLRLLSELGGPPPSSFASREPGGLREGMHAARELKPPTTPRSLIRNMEGPGEIGCLESASITRKAGRLPESGTGLPHSHSSKRAPQAHRSHGRRASPLKTPANLVTRQSFSTCASNRKQQGSRDSGAGHSP